MNLVKTTLLSGLNTAVRMAAGLLSVKAMAIFVGPAGVAYLGQFQCDNNLKPNMFAPLCSQGVHFLLLRF